MESFRRIIERRETGDGGDGSRRAAAKFCRPAKYEYQSRAWEGEKERNSLGRILALARGCSSTDHRGLPAAASPLAHLSLTYCPLRSISPIRSPGHFLHPHFLSDSLPVVLPPLLAMMALASVPHYPMLMYRTRRGLERREGRRGARSVVQRTSPGSRIPSLRYPSRRGMRTGRVLRLMVAGKELELDRGENGRGKTHERLIGRHVRQNDPWSIKLRMIECVGYHTCR